jgi:peroxiredoxin (alkyl hydroperoxide reductase subunit C)
VRNCNVVVVSVDTKRSLWYWESISRRDGGLGHIKIPLLYDVDGALGRAYGVLLQDDGLDLRGLFILDGRETMQQVSVVCLWQFCRDDTRLS